MTSFNGDDGEDVDPRHLSPLDVDVAGLHELIKNLTEALHEYVDVAVGIRAEFDAATAEDDPRIDAVEDRVGQINAQISERFEADLGFISSHTNEMWDSGDTEHEAHVIEGFESLTGSVFEMGFLVVRASAAASIDSAFALVESGGERIARELAEAGFEVQEWAASRSYIEGGSVDDDQEGDIGGSDA